MPSIPVVAFIMHVAIKSPFTETAEITAVPKPVQTTFPLLTIATFVSDDSQVTFLLRKNWAYYVNHEREAKVKL